MDADLRLPQSLPVPNTIDLGLTKTYARDWTTSDAFRELYQNWKDAIIQSYDLSATDFSVNMEDREDMALITVHRQNADNTGECLGYVRFQAGAVEFTNFRATMSASCLEMGHSTKTEDVRLAGRHGEGLKIAALVMRREGFHVRVRSNGHFWNFGFRGKNGDRFYYQLNQASSRRLDSLRTKFNKAREQGTPRELRANIWEDVSITVGQIRRYGQPVSVNTFSDWRKATIDLQNLSKFVQTVYGKLILDPDYAGQLYVKGLRVSRQESRDIQYRYSYDFLGPDIVPNRDRRLDVHPEREAEAVAAIWDAAMKDEDSVIQIYTELLKEDPGSADVAFADTYITLPTARKVWACLADDAKKNRMFYFPVGYEDDNIQLIQCELKCTPVPVPYQLWRLLRKYGLVKLPFEEIYHHFQQSKEVEPPTTLFARETGRAFGALFGMHAPSKETRIVYVQFTVNLPNMAYSKRDDTLYVHEKWLDFQRAHRTSPCEISDLGSVNAVSFCHHIVDDMFKSAILAVRRPIDPPYRIMVKDVQSLQSLILRCKEKTCEMPYNIQVSAGATPDSLQVTWKDNFRRSSIEQCGSLLKYIVILHDAACILEAHRLWYQENRVTCGCPRNIVPLAPNGTKNVAIFEDLDHTPRFPMVARFNQRSTEPTLWGLPPSAISPSSSEESPHQPTFDEGFSESKSTASYSPVLTVSQVGEDGKDGGDALPERIVEMARHYDWYIMRLTMLGAASLENVRRMLNSLHAGISPPNNPTSVPISSPPPSTQVQTGQYLRSNGPSGTLLILYVHELECVDQSLRALVTQYSSLPQVWANDPIMSASMDSRELLLHYSNFEHMGDKADAEWLIIDELSDLRTTEVLHVSEKPDSGVNYFCRFAIWKTSEQTCSLCPLGDHVPKMAGSVQAPILSPLPAPAVFDFSPQAIGLSIGFQRAQCRINTAVGDVKTHALWQAHHPEARLVDAVDQVLQIQDQSLKPPMCRIAVISANVSGDPSLESLSSALSTCCFIAEHANNPEFIFLAIDYTGWEDSHSLLLHRSLHRLLEAKYSVHIRLKTVTSEDNPLFFVLAAPLSMDPQDFDNHLNDLDCSSVVKTVNLSCDAYDLEAIPVAKGFDRRTVDLLTPSDYKHVLLGVSPTFACQIATAICHVCGKLGARRRGLSEV